MLTVPKLIAQLRRKGTSITLAQGDIRLKNITGEDYQILEGERANLLTFLRAREAASKRGPLLKTLCKYSPSLSQDMWLVRVPPKSVQETSFLIPILIVMPTADIQLVEAAILASIKRHDILRSFYHLDNGQLQVSFNSWDEFKIQFDKLQPVGKTTDNERLKRYYNEFCSSSLPATGKWLIKANILELPENRTAAMIVMNHLVSDGHSVSIIKSDILRNMREISASGSNCRNDSVIKTEDQMNFFDHAAWERKWFCNAKPALLAYWSDALASVPHLEMPTLRRVLRWDTGDIATTKLVFPSLDWINVRKFAKKIKTSPGLVYITALTLAVADVSEQRRFIISSVANARRSQLLSSAVGFFSGSDAIPVEVDTAANFRENLNSIAVEYAASIELRPPTKDEFFPKFFEGNDNLPVMINYHPAAQAHAGVEAGMLSAFRPFMTKDPPGNSAASRPPITLDVVEGGDTLLCKFRMLPSYITEDEQVRLINKFFHILKEIMDTGHIV